MAKHKQDRNQLALDFGQASINVAVPTESANTHAQFPPPSLALLKAEETTPDESELPIPVPTPLPEAVAKCVFGTDENDDPVEPSAEEVHEISRLHGERLAELYASLAEVNDRSKALSAEQSIERLKEKERLTCQIQGLLGLYAEDFGEVAARHLQSWAQHEAGHHEPADSTSETAPVVSATNATEPQYDPGHPWYYLARGDGQPPLQLGNIPPNTCDGRFVGKLPKGPVKRQAKLMQLLTDESAHLNEFEKHYRDLIERGAEALSQYDREIAYGGDRELAVASSLALRVNHIGNSRGRIQWLKAELGLLGDVTSQGSVQASRPTRAEQLPTVAVSQIAVVPTTSSRSEKLDKLHETVDKALDQLAAALQAGKSETLVSWLKTMSRFHNYSLNNQMLIAWQRPDATHVAGFHAWKKFNRLVSKGEKGIMILAPVTRTVGAVEETKPDGQKAERKLRQIVNCKPAYVFDISQTHGDPLPELARMQGNPSENTEHLKELIQREGIELQYADRLPGGAQGNSQGGRIAIMNGLSAAEEFRTLAHEFAHELLHRGERREETTKRSRELEAESVAFVVCNTIGLDARQTSSDYIQLFRGDKAMLLESLQFIRQVSQKILNGLLDNAPRFDQEAA